MNAKGLFRCTQLILCLAACTQIGCHTISPDLPISNNPSPGPNGMHSGVYAVIHARDGSIKAQVWYEQNRTEYNALIGKYGSQFIPPIKADDHLTEDGAYWKADGIAISHYILLLDLKAKDRNP